MHDIMCDTLELFVPEKIPPSSSSSSSSSRSSSNNNNSNRNGDHRASSSGLHHSSPRRNREKIKWMKQQAPLTREGDERLATDAPGQSSDLTVQQTSWMKHHHHMHTTKKRSKKIQAENKAVDCTLYHNNESIIPTNSTQAIAETDWPNHLKAQFDLCRCYSCVSDRHIRTVKFYWAYFGGLYWEDQWFYQQKEAISIIMVTLMIITWEFSLGFGEKPEAIWWLIHTPCTTSIRVLVILW